MKTMSLYESKESSAAVSLSSLFTNTLSIEEEKSCSDIEIITDILMRGGWPVAVTKNIKDVSSNYIETLVNFDVHNCDDVKRSPLTAREVLQEYARCTSTQTALATMCKNLKNRGGEVSRPTFVDYISAFRKLHIIDELPAWQPSLKAKARTTSTPKRYLVDPSLACAAMRANKKRCWETYRPWVTCLRIYACVT